MGSSAERYGVGGLETVGGAVLSVFGMPEIGVPLMTAGVGGLAGQGAGGSKGFNIGELSGGALGGGFEGLGALGAGAGGAAASGGGAAGAGGAASATPAAGAASSGAGGSSNLTSLMSSPLAQHFLSSAMGGGQQQPPSQGMQPAQSMAMRPGGAAPSLPQAPQPPQIQPAAMPGPLMALFQKLMGGQGIG